MNDEQKQITEWRERVRKEFARLTAEREDYKHRALLRVVATADR